MTAPQVSLHEIPVENIQVLARQRKDLGSLQDLIGSMGTEGQLQPGMVRPVTQDDIDTEGADPAIPWVLVAGERRFRSVIMAGLPTYLAINRGELPKLDQKVYELTENLFRKPMNWDEEANARREIHELRVQSAALRGEKWTLADTARELGGSGATISRDIQVAKAIEADPTLKNAGSKKAAVRVIEFREHLARQTLQLSRAPNARLTELLVCADARQWIRTLGTGCASAVITDFPYGGDFTTSGMKRKAGETSLSDYDDSEAVTLDLFVDMVPQLLRITKHEGWIATFMSESNYEYLRELFETCCTTHFEYGKVEYVQLPNGDWRKLMPEECSAHEPNKRCLFPRAEVPGWIWYRPNSQNPSRVPEWHAKNYHEHILVVNRGGGRLYKHQNECPTVLMYDADYGNERLHQMQKPRAIGRELALRLTMPGELVVDPFMGSGNLLAGATEVQRQIQGSENNPLAYELVISNVSKFYGG